MSFFGANSQGVARAIQGRKPPRGTMKKLFAIAAASLGVAAIPSDASASGCASPFCGGQGAGWGEGGHTPDPVGTGPATPGSMTQGIEDPESYFYRRVFVDAVHAVDAVRAIEGVDAERVAITGGSQGGGMTIAAAALCEGLKAAMPDVPFLSHFSRAIEITDAAGGEFTLALTGAQTAALDERRHQFEVWITLASAEPKRYVRGALEILRTVRP